MDKRKNREIIFPIRLNDDEKKVLDALAKNAERTRSDMIRMLIRHADRLGFTMAGGQNG